MSKGYICVYDSGIGGISVLLELQKLMPDENYIYIGDNGNAPYGAKSRRKLLSLAVDNISLAMKYPIKALVLGCNTLSTTIGEELRGIFNFPIFGVYPPVECEIIKGRKILLICTPNTAQFFNESNQVNIYVNDGLAKYIEDNAFNIDNLSFDKFFTKQRTGFTTYDSVILGCTHYVLAQKQILDHLKFENMTNGNHFTAISLYNFLKTTKSLEKNKQIEVLFLGNSANKNRNFYYFVVKKG